jgi:biopolymer transport protein ExbD
MKILQSEDAAAPGRARRGRRVATSLAEINVVPLVDVMLVLLIIFMITAPMIQRGVDVKLPVARQAERISGERLFVTVPLTYRRNRLVYLGDEALRLEILQERVRQKMQGQTDKQVYLRGDGGVQLQELMEVFSGLQAAGVNNIGILLRAPGEQ